MIALIVKCLDNNSGFYTGERGNGKKCNTSIPGCPGQMHTVWRLIFFRANVFSMINRLTVIKIMVSPISNMLFQLTLLLAIKLGVGHAHPRLCKTSVGFTDLVVGCL